MYAGADLVLTISPRLSEYVTLMGAYELNARVLPLGVDTELFRPGGNDKELRQQCHLGDNPVIVFIGTLYDFSGLDAVIRQLSDVINVFPGVKLLIVGDGPQRAELERITAETGMEQNVIITGFQPYEIMPNYINIATVCINPFLITDTTRDIFPNKIVQYMACAKPVLATRLPGLEAMVAGEGQGMVYVELEDTAVTLIRILEADERRKQFGRAALRYIRQTHSYESIVKRLEVELHEVVRNLKIK